MLIYLNIVNKLYPTYSYRQMKDDLIKVEEKLIDLFEDN